MKNAATVRRRGANQGRRAQDRLSPSGRPVHVQKEPELQIVSSPIEMQRLAEAARCRGERIALVPTMGYLHEGHLSLMREGRRLGTMVVASIFVNPTQFGANEDFSRYPRDMERDCSLMRTVPVDVLFAPQASDMYLSDSQTWVEVTKVTQGLCGPLRPGHFRGVATVVAKLFNIVKPHFALFGEKDFQQLRTIQRMVQDLNMDLEIIPMPTVREADGIAMSSRNVYLSPSERETALCLSRALAAARNALATGTDTAAQVAGVATAVLQREPGVTIEYVEAVDAESLEPVGTVERPIVVAIAARVGKVRLIDNAVLTPELSA
jgi:pantoate--beta-alanine ligase